MMKKYTCFAKIMLFLCFMSCSCGFVVAQNNTLNQYPTELRNGIEVYRYAVEKGEGLYRVSNKFGVSQEEILALNPGIKADGLKLGQIIYIPKKSADASAPSAIAADNKTNSQDNKSNAAVTDNADTAKFIYHVIEPKETLFALSRRYGVPVKQIEDLNPTLVPKLPVGKVLRIPRTISAQKAAEQNPEQPITPVAQSPAPVQDTIIIVPDTLTTMLVAIADSLKNEAFNKVKQDSIAAAALDSTLAAVRDSLIADSLDRVYEQSLSLEADGYPTDFLMLQDSAELIPIRVAYLLPLMLNASRRDANMDRFLEFYEGSLLAINDLQRQGLRIEAYVFDIEKNDITMQAVLKSPQLRAVDAIIGPAYPAQVDFVSQFAKEERLPVIVPFTPNVYALDTNQYILRFNMSAQQEAELMAEYLAIKNSDINVIIIDTESGAEENEGVMTLVESLKKNHVSVTNTKFTNLRSALKSNKENVLVYKTMKWQEVQATFTELTSLLWDYNLSLVGQYSWGKNDIPVKMYYTSIFDADDSIKEDLYSEEFNRYYNYPLSNTRPRYDMLGYDITVFTFKMLYENQWNNQSNKSLQEIIPQVDYRGVQSNIHFDATTPEGGFVNRGYVKECAGNR